MGGILGTLPTAAGGKKKNGIYLPLLKISECLVLDKRDIIIRFFVSLYDKR